jgi:hypothetical protein
MIRPLITTLCLANILCAQWHEAKRHDLDFHAAQAYCSALGPSWRVPTIKELFSLRGNPDFSREDSFWSATTAYDGLSRIGTGSEGDAGAQQGAKIGYAFFLRDGDVTLTPLTKKTSVICTDTPLQPKQPRYETTEEGVVDHDNAILWAHLDSHEKTEKRSYEKAQEFCEMSDLHGRSWRLPTVDELYSIVTYERIRPSVPVDYFGVMMSRYYWSDDALNDKQAYVVGFKLGSVATSDRSNRSYFRCVSDIEE